MEKDSTLTTESYISMPTILSSAASKFQLRPATLSENGYDDGTYMDRRLSVPLCMDNCRTIILTSRDI
jgi:hypothetical protein